MTRFHADALAAAHTQRELDMIEQGSGADMSDRVPVEVIEETADADVRVGAAELATLRAEVERLRKALVRLSTAACFGNGDALGLCMLESPMGREILARMDFAKEALE